MLIWGIVSYNKEVKHTLGWFLNGQFHIFITVLVRYYYVSLKNKMESDMYMGCSTPLKKWINWEAVKWQQLGILSMFLQLATKNTAALCFPAVKLPTLSVMLVENVLPCE